MTTTRLRCRQICSARRDCWQLFANCVHTAAAPTRLNSTVESRRRRRCVWALCHIVIVCSRVIGTYGVSECAEQVSVGLYFRGSGYALVQGVQHSQPPTFSLTSGFTMTIQFRSATNNATLVIAWRSMNCFAYLGLVSGKVQFWFFSSSCTSYFFFFYFFFFSLKWSCSTGL